MFSRPERLKVVFASHSTDGEAVLDQVVEVLAPLTRLHLWGGAAQAAVLIRQTTEKVPAPAE